MRKLSTLLGSLGLLYASATMAVPIPDTVSVEGREWAQVDLFSELSWGDIESVCPGGFCGPGTLNGYAMSGWQWAGVEDINSLFNSYLRAAGVTGDDLLGPGPDQLNGAGSTWAEQILLDFRPTWESCDPEPNSCTIFELNGWTSDTAQSSQYLLAYVGGVRNRVHPLGGDQVSSSSTFIRDSRNTSVGGYFFRVETVPLPSSVALFVIGLLLMGTERKIRS